jgi:hypothetical protein
VLERGAEAPAHVRRRGRGVRGGRDDRRDQRLPAGVARLLPARAGDRPESRPGPLGAVDPPRAGARARRLRAARAGGAWGRGAAGNPRRRHRRRGGPPRRRYADRGGYADLDRRDVSRARRTRGG